MIDAFLRGDNPDILNISKPTKPHTRFSYFYVLAISLISLTISTLIFNNHLLASIVLFIIGVLAFILFLGAIQEYQKEKKKELQIYQARLFDYEELTKRQEELKSITKDKNASDRYAKNRIKGIALSATKFEIENYNIATKGNSESYFYTELKKVFGNNVSIDVTIPNQQWTFPFIPDIVFSNGSITIDIEIDEPYTYNKLQPIHYFDTDKQKHTDADRDDYFSENNWAVVRFTERQVYKNPRGCCKTIAEMIFEITGDNNLLLKLNDAKNLETENFWTIAQAKELAKTDFRNSYNGTIFLQDEACP